jgi:iron complex outermembrane recepter protein
MKTRPSLSATPRSRTFVCALVCAFASPGLHAQQASAVEVKQNDTLVVTGSRLQTEALRVPAAIERSDADAAALAQPGINASETLARLPGLTVNNRLNFAQDLQVSLRGFGARASFGVRGVKLYQDGMPLTMPDGQGQTGGFDLDSAEHWEVLRGPLAVMYGNSAGGVVQLFSDFSKTEPGASMQLHSGSYDTMKLGLGAWGKALDLITLSANYAHAESTGYRLNSAMVRDTANLRARMTVGNGNLTLIMNKLDQPNTQDPLGLTAAQFADNPRAAGNGAAQFKTRKSVEQHQSGLVWDGALTDMFSLKVALYGGHRDVEQYLAQAGTAPTSSGGVVKLTRGFQGLNAQAAVTLGALRLILGADADDQKEERRGYVNNNGVRAAIKRDEDDKATNRDLWLQADWQATDALSFTAGVRRASVKFDVKDKFITAANPDDSGNADYSHTNAMLGASWLFAPKQAVYAAYGKGFETPTLAEIAYRADGGAGTNLALKPAIHNTAEIGYKAQYAQGDVRVALFDTRVSDEIVSAGQLQPGRNVFTNATKTTRSGVEMGASHRFSEAWRAMLNVTYLNARFTDYTAATGTNLSGLKLPGIAQKTAFAELEYRVSDALRTALEWRGSSAVWANDANTASAAGYGVAALRATYQWGCGKELCKLYARADNLSNRHYAGSVIVNAANAQYYESAPDRNVSVGVALRF